MLAYRIEPDYRALSVILANPEGDTGVNVLQDGHIMAEVTVKLHAQLAQGTAGYHHHVLINIGADKPRGHRHGMNRGTTKCFNIGTGGVPAAAQFTDRFGDVTTSPVVAAAHGFFPHSAQ